jgi:hypothetical protein
MKDEGGMMKNYSFQFVVFSRNRHLAATTLETKN